MFSLRPLAHPVTTSMPTNFRGIAAGIVKNPVTGRVYAFHTGSYQYSDDAGKTWHQGDWPFSGHPGFTRARYIVFTGGKIVVCADDPDNVYTFRVALSDNGDDGQWHVTSPISTGNPNSGDSIAVIRHTGGHWIFGTAHGYVYYSSADLPSEWTNAGEWPRSSGFSSAYPLYDALYERGYIILSGFSRIRYATSLTGASANTAYPDNNPSSSNFYYRIEVSPDNSRFVLFKQGPNIYYSTTTPASWTSQLGVYGAIAANGGQPFGDGYMYFCDNTPGNVRISRTTDMVTWQNLNLGTSLGGGPAYGVGVLDDGTFVLAGSGGLLAFNNSTWSSGTWVRDYTTLDTTATLFGLLDVNGAVLIGGVTGYVATTETLTISGIVRDRAGVPCQRKVRFYRRDDGRFLGERLSDPVTGYYEQHFGGYYEIMRIVLADDAAEGVLLNDITDRVLPD